MNAHVHRLVASFDTGERVSDQTLLESLKWGEDLLPTLLEEHERWKHPGFRKNAAVLLGRMPSEMVIAALQRCKVGAEVTRGLGESQDEPAFRLLVSLLRRHDYMGGLLRRTYPLGSDIATALLQNYRSARVVLREALLLTPEQERALARAGLPGWESARFHVQTVEAIKSSMYGWWDAWDHFIDDSRIDTELWCALVETRRKVEERWAREAPDRATSPEHLARVQADAKKAEPLRAAARAASAVAASDIKPSIRQLHVFFKGTGSPALLEKVLASLYSVHDLRSVGIHSYDLLGWSDDNIFAQAVAAVISRGLIPQSSSPDWLAAHILTRRGSAHGQPFYILTVTD